MSSQSWLNRLCHIAKLGSKGHGTLPLLEQLASTVGRGYQSGKPYIIMLLLEINLKENQAHFSHSQGIFLTLPLKHRCKQLGRIRFFQNEEKPS